MQMLKITKKRTFENLDSNNPYHQKVVGVIDEWTKTKQIIVSTSGSTGEPKQIQLEENQVKTSIRQTQKAFSLTSETIGFCCLSVEFIAGKLMLLRAWEIGYEVCIVEPSSNPFIVLNKKEINYLLSNQTHLFFAFVPLQLTAIFTDNHSVEIINNTKTIVVGGAKINEQLIEKIQSINTPVFATYGMTETVTHVAIRRENGEQKSNYFTTLEGIEIRKNLVNCLEIKGLTTKNNWLTTTDLVEIYDKNSFELLGRIDNIINSGGIKISLEKVEDSIEKILKKLQINTPFFCYGQPDEKLGQRLVLYIEIKKTDEILHQIEIGLKDLPKFEQPKKIHLLSQFFWTKSGKIDKLKTSHVFH